MTEFRNELERCLAKGPPPNLPRPRNSIDNGNLQSSPVTAKLSQPKIQPIVKSSAKNLISNSSGENGYDGWTLKKVAGSKWEIKVDPFIRCAVPTNKFLGVVPKASETCCFVTSYGIKSYLVDLREKLGSLIGQSFEIKCGQMYMARGDCGGEFLWRLSLLDDNKRVLKKYEAEYIEILDKNADSAVSWKRAEFSMKFCPENRQLVRRVRYLEFLNDVRDKKHLGNNSGIKFARSTVVLVDPSSTEKKRDEEISSSRKIGEKKNSFVNIGENNCFDCPVCFEVPKDKKVFQCKNGHMICEDCISQVDVCPQCRTPMGSKERIRNRAMEAVLEAMNI